MSESPDFSREWTLYQAARYLLGPGSTISAWDSLEKDMRHDALLGELAVREVHRTSIGSIRAIMTIRYVKPKDIIEWAYTKKKPVGAVCSDWYSGVKKSKAAKKSAVDGYISTIIAAISSRGHSKHHVPYGEKADIKKWLVGSTHVMTSANFDSAWKAASGAGLLAIEGKEKFSKGGSKK